MIKKQAAIIFARINQLWPDWLPFDVEKQEWIIALMKIPGEKMADKAVSNYYQTSGKYKRPCLPDYLHTARRLWREKRALSRKNTEPVLHFTIARQKSPPNTIQLGYKFFGKPEVTFDAIQHAAENALKEVKQVYGGNWAIIYP